MQGSHEKRAKMVLDAILNAYIAYDGAFPEHRQDEVVVLLHPADASALQCVVTGGRAQTYEDDLHSRINCRILPLRGSMQPGPYPPTIVLPGVLQAFLESAIGAGFQRLCPPEGAP